MSGSRACVIALYLIVAPAVVAHGDLHQRLQVATAAIEADPTNGTLHLERARIHRQHEDWDAAFADIHHAMTLGVDSRAAAMLRSALLMDTNRPEDALAILDDLVERDPADGAAHMARGRSLLATGAPRAAAVAFRTALDHIAPLLPRHYLAWSGALAQAGDFDAAIAALDTGIADLGPLIVLEAKALELERRSNRGDAAITRLDGIISRVRRPEKWLALRGDVLADCGRREAARASRLAALEAIARLPRSRRATGAVLALETTIHRRLAGAERHR